MRWTPTRWTLRSRSAQAFPDHQPPPAPPVADPRSLWIIPWLVSLAAHLCLVGGAVVVVWSVREVLSDDRVIAQVSLSDEPGATLQIQTPTPVKLPPPTVPTPPTPATPAVPLLPADAIEPALEAALPRFDDPLPPPPSFAVAPPAASEFKAEFMGLGGNAETIVFVLEADGSIISDYPQIVGHLRRSLGNLSEKQRFTVIVYDGNAAKEVPPAGLRRATPDAKSRAIRWLDDTANVETTGSGDPVAGLKLAFKYKPGLVYLLAENISNKGGGQYEIQRERILQAVDATPAGTAINTIELNRQDRLAFDDEGQKISLTLMEMIAQQTGGNHKFVTTNTVP